MAFYPGATYPVPVFGTNMSDAKTHSDWRDEITDELRAVQIELGAHPSGASPTVTSRLNTIEGTAAGLMPKAGGTFTGNVFGIAPASASALTTKTYVDSNFVDLTGDTMSGTLLVDAATIALRAGGVSGDQVQVVDSNGGDSAFIGYYGQGSSITSIGTRTGLVGQVGTAHMEIRSEESGADVRLRALADVVFVNSGSTERARIVSTAFLFGKAGSSLDGPGVEIMCEGSSVEGSIRTTITSASAQNIYCRHEGAANANTIPFEQYLSTSTVIGSVTQVNTTGVAFNTTSDERLKTVLRDLDDDEIATILRLIAPVVYEFNAEPGNLHVGFIAQRLAETWPQFVDVGIVTVGQNEPGDEVEYVEVVETVDVDRVRWLTHQVQVVDEIPIMEDVAVVDDDGEPVLDAAGRPQVEQRQALDAAGVPMVERRVRLDDAGEPVLEMRDVVDEHGRRQFEKYTETVEVARLEPVPGTGFVPWMVHLAAFVPLLVAGWQAHDRRLEALEAAAA